MAKKKLKKATEATTTVTTKTGPVSEKTDYRLFNTTTMVKSSGKRKVSGKKKTEAGSVTKAKGHRKVSARFAKSFR